MKTKLQKNKLIIIFLIVSIILNFALIYFHFINKNCVEVQEVLFTETKKDFNSEKKYYATIDYNKFKKLFKSEKLSTIAVLDNSSNTHDKFIELINSISYYKSTKIYLLETSKLSKKSNSYSNASKNNSKKYSKSYSRNSRDNSKSYSR